MRIPDSYKYIYILKSQPVRQEWFTSVYLTHNYAGPSIHSIEQHKTQSCARNTQEWESRLPNPHSRITRLALRRMIKILTALTCILSESRGDCWHGSEKDIFFPGHLTRLSLLAACPGMVFVRRRDCTNHEYAWNVIAGLGVYAQRERENLKRDTVFFGWCA